MSEQAAALRRMARVVRSRRTNVGALAGVADALAGAADTIEVEAEALAAADEMAEQLQEDGPLIVEGDAVARYLAARGHPGGPWWPR